MGILNKQHINVRSQLPVHAHKKKGEKPEMLHKIDWFQDYSSENVSWRKIIWRLSFVFET